MAYVYSNALNVSIALVILGLIQIALAISCVFGCYAGYDYTYASPGWSGIWAFITGVFGICMVRSYKEVILGTCFFVLSIIALLTSTACLVLVALFAWRAEFQLAHEAQQLALRQDEDQDTRLDATGLAIHTCALFVGLCLFITSCYASWLNCCCEKGPIKKGYGLAIEPVRVVHADSSNRHQHTTV